MPQLHRKTFSRRPPPDDLQPAERLFYCRTTNEVFRDYDEFFERTILCNSLVWSCSFTGKSGLTYQEAQESERKVRRSLQNFPDSLGVPILHIATLANHQRVSELCDDIYDYMKTRFFIGETVTVVRNSAARLECTVLEIKAPPPEENGMTNGHDNVPSDTIVISDSDDDSVQEVPVTCHKKEPIDSSLFKYKVKPVVQEMYEYVTVKQNQVSRKSSLFSYERLKHFLKLHCETQHGIVRPKASSIIKYHILGKSFFHYFPDEAPRFVLSAEKKAAAARRHLRRDHATKEAAAARERERIRQQKKEMKAMEIEKERLRKERAERMQSRNREMYDKVMLQKEEFKKTVQVERLKKQEEQKMIKLEREKEREKIRAEKRKYAERLKLWHQRRDDLECDDLKDLPSPVPVKTRLPPDCFGDAIMVLEFLYAFGTLFDLQDEFPEGMTLEILEEALVGNNPEGPLCELLFFFLSAIFQALAEEAEDVANDQITEAKAKALTEALGEDTDTTKSALYAVASLAAAWPQLNHGCSLKELDLDSCTLSEILRLHILASGAESNSANAQYRYQKQGGFLATDDACLELRINHPAILKKLSSTSVYDLLPDEKLKILHALCGKLLTLVSTRDYIEDCIEELRQMKHEFRELKAEQNRREREEAAARIRKRKEEKLKELELKIKDKEDKLREDESNSSPKIARNGEQDDLDTSIENKDVERGDQDVAVEDEGLSPGGKKRKGLKVKNIDPLEKKESSAICEELLRRKQEKKEQELFEKMQHVASCTNIIPLGRDRWYRRFWTFYSIPGLFVEEDYTNVTEDMLQPQPLSEMEMEYNPTVNGHESPVKDAEEKVELPKPVDKPNRWSYYSSVDQLDELIESLNTRGYRERNLKDMLVQEKPRICQKLSNFPTNRFHISDSPPPTDIKPLKGRPVKVQDPTQKPAEKQLEFRLCELLLDIEDRVYQGTLGSVKVPDRQTWRLAVGTCSYDLLDNETKSNGAVKFEDMEIENDMNQSNKDRLQTLKTESQSGTSTTASTPQPATNSVHYLAQALLQIEQGVERKYLKAPLGDAEDCKKSYKFDKKKDDKKKKDEDQTGEKDDGSDNGRVQRTLLDRWRESLLAAGSLSQIFIHLSTLERSILWSRSICNFRCKVCRKKGDNESMILCDGCERGHHIYCVRPKLKFIPEGAWFCPECKPRKRTRRPNRKRPSLDSDEEEEEDLLEEDDDDNNVPEQFEDAEEIAMSEEESSAKKGKAKLKLPLKTKGKPGRKPGPKKGSKRESGKTSKSQPVTPKNSGQSPKGRGRGKKANSAPPLEKKPGSHSSVLNPEANAEAHDTLLVELVSGKGRGRGRGRGKKIKSDSTPVGSPFAFRPFTLDNAEETPKGRKAQSQTSTPSQVEGKGRGKRLLAAEMSSGDNGSRRSSGRHQGVHELSACEQLVVELVRHDDSWPFMKVVSKIQVPDYFDIIKRPIALNIIREKVNKCEYKSASEFVADIDLMFANCFEYNSVESNEAKAGVRLKSFFMDEAQKLGLDVNASAESETAPFAKKSRI
ncbi:bromodomain adjacent to zinc finger domain protein 1A isoform 1-T2 [Anomaloglossus baeobatrachus]|uniref:bromodomain adjacent to zinc finger domain protein 1A n=1 Tax=Anomaloglossus baeobatrachus TaxID=238106 RepID=UPI003F4F64C4